MQRRTLLLPVGDQLVQRNWLEHGAGKDMRAHLRAFLDDTHADVVVVLSRQLFESNRRRESRWAGADDYDIVFHRFALPPSA